MERKAFRRIIRDRHLTEGEIVADEQIRSQVIQEFPPTDTAVPQAGCRGNLRLPTAFQSRLIGYRVANAICQ